MLNCLIAACLTALAAEAETARKEPMPAYTVACYYFPNYHVDPRNEARHGQGWTEWELVKQAKPRYPGHRQPKVPLWGHGDESDPAVMAQKIDAAADHGVHAFIFDWYYYDDGLFLERCVERGFMKTPNAARMKFALMWANHDWFDIHPATLNRSPELLYPGPVTPETFERMTDYVIDTYFKHPSYWTIDGCPYFSVYELHTLVKSFGGVDAVARAMAQFREKVRAAGFPGLHLNAVSWGVQLLPGETAVDNPEALIARIGFDSVTSYVWVHDAPLPQSPETPYAEVLEKVESVWQRNVGRFGVPYFPNVTMGWDSSPRCNQDDPFGNTGYPFTNILGGNTPAAFRNALERVKAFIDSHPNTNKTITINCWNEWTEGSYLEPDTENGMAYLEAIRDVFRP